jgi:hypothetical protein
MGANRPFLKLLGFFEARILGLRNNSSGMKTSKPNVIPSGAYPMDPDRRIMKQMKEPLPKIRVETVGRHLRENAKGIVLLGSLSRTMPASLQAIAELFPHAVHFRADGPDAVFDWREGEPIIIENFERLSRSTRQFILDLGNPLVLIVKNPRYWQLLLMQKAGQVMRM